MSAKVFPPGPRTLIPGGNLFAFRRDPLGYLMRLKDEYGDIVHLRFGRQHVFSLNHPEHIKNVFVTDHNNFIKGRGLQRSKRLLGEGLLTSEKEFHRRQRKLAQPAFHRQRIAAYASAMVESAGELSAGWQANRVVDISREMNRLTLSIVGKTLFGANLEAETQQISDALTVVMKMFWTNMLPFAELFEKLPLPAARRFREAREQLDRVIYRIIDERRASQTDTGDLLSMLLLAQDEDADKENSNEASRGMTDEQVRDEAMTIFLAGHETTANALAWS